MKKLLSAVLGLCVLGLFATKAQAATATDNAYVVVRCTVTIAVDVLTGYTTWYVNGSSGIAPGETMISPFDTVRVENPAGSGAITKWALHVGGINKASAATYPDPIIAVWAADSGDTAWTIDTAPGVVKVALDALFASADKSSGDSWTDAALDTVTGLTGNTYEVGNDARFSPGADGYASALGNSSGPNYVASGAAHRKLQFRLRAPTAVADEDWRQIVVVVTAGLATAWAE